ncbi:MAG: YceK/YidQ family lipoprotein [Lentisphaeraceae bacterium]|nr:YceK/YidQ family lipoprotein [Lentisphaeraceae bacterium]
MKLRILITLSLLFCSCSSFLTRSKMSAETRYKENFIYYTGTRVNYEVLTNQSEKQLFLRYALGIPDLPLSMIMDTVFVPIDFVVYEKEKARDGKPESLMESLYKDTVEMLSHLRLNELNKFQHLYVDQTDVQTSLFDVDLKNLDEASIKATIEVLDKFKKEGFDKPSYERAGRIYFKGSDYLISFRVNNGVWQISTLSLELN